MTPQLRQQMLKLACHYRNISFQDLPEVSKDCWTTYCPVHEPDRQSNPSLRVYIHINKQTGAEELGVKCNSCTTEVVVQKLRQDGMLPKLLNTSSPKDYTVNIPPHAEPDWSITTFNNWPVTDHWAFLNSQGQIVYWHIRVDDPDAKYKGKKNPKSKAYSRIYSVTNKESKVFFANSAVLKDKPIPYNAYYLSKRLQAPVLIVEGPKTADAASKLYPEYVVLTWDQGAGNFHKFDWSLLQGRQSTIVLFPDMDEPGIKGMQGLAKLLISLDLKPLIAFTHVPDGYLKPNGDDGWDLADPIPENVVHPDILIGEAEEVTVSQEELQTLLNNHKLADKFEVLDNRIAMVLGDKGAILYYDLDIIDPMSKSGCPYPMYNLDTLKKIFHEKYFEDNKEKLVIEAWLERPPVRLYNSLTYNPTTTEKAINIAPGVNYLNLFMGFAVQPIESTPQDSQWFINHLNKLLGFQEASYNLDYLSDIIQNPGQKPGTLLSWVGSQGTGKSVIGKIIVKLLGQMNAVVINAKILGDQFTTEFASKLFIMAEELPDSIRSREQIEQELKFLITSDTVRLNNKGVIAYQIPSFHRIIITANSANSIRFDEDDRRTSIFQCNSGHLHKIANLIDDDVYFNPLYAKINDPIAMGKLMYYLSTRSIVHRVNKPYNTEIKQILQRPKNPVYAFVEDLLESATLPIECIPLKTNWPQEPIVMPRSVIVDAVINYCKQNKLPEPKKKIITSTLLTLMPPDVFGKENSKTFEMHDNKNNVYTTARERVFELLTIDKQRKIYEAITGNIPIWSAINTVKLPEEPTNVIPLKPLAKEVL